jgi:hypothetical protein
MTVRLAFTGASGTGKSTLATAIATKLSLPICPTGSREVAKAMGFDNPYDVDGAGKRAEFQKRLFAAKAAWEHTTLDSELPFTDVHGTLAGAGHRPPPVGGFVTDRTYLDNLAYTAMHSRETAAEPMFREVVIQAMQIYTHIVFCPVRAFHNLADDPARVSELTYHHEYECILMEMLGRHVHGAPILWLTTSILGDRLLQIERFVRP